MVKAALTVDSWKYRFDFDGWYILLRKKSLRRFKFNVYYCGWVQGSDMLQVARSDYGGRARDPSAWNKIFHARVLQLSEDRSPCYKCTYAERVLQSLAKHFFCPRGKNQRLVASLYTEGFEVTRVQRWKGSLVWYRTDSTYALECVIA